MKENIEWQALTLGDVCRLRGGAAFSPSLQGRRDGDVPFIKVRDFNSVQNSVHVQHADHWVLAADAPRIQGDPFPVGTSVFAKIGEALKHNRVRLLIRPTYIDNNLMGAVPKIDVVEPEFLFHTLRTFNFAATNSGTAVPYITASVLAQSPVRVPPRQIQLRIVSILGAYDDLIEVNRRRIALLEEASRQLFEEWFVHFRFPGHADDDRIDTPQGPLPQGWEWRSMASVCVEPSGIQTGPFGSQLHQSDYVDDGVPVVMPKNIVDLNVVEDGIARISEEKANELGRHRMSVGDVVYGRRGDIGRRAHISARENGWFCGTGCLRLRPDTNQVSSRFFFDALGLPATFGTIRARAQGATMPNLSAGVMADVPVMVPPLGLQQRYEKCVEPSAVFAANLRSANAVLCRSRDLLLPRLISGGLPVATADRELEAVV